jgi:hypothetical protein
MATEQPLTEATQRVQAGRNPLYRSRATTIGDEEDSFAPEEITLRAEQRFAPLNDIAYKVARIAISPEGPEERRRQLEQLVAISRS